LLTKIIVDLLSYFISDKSGGLKVNPRIKKLILKFFKLSAILVYDP